MIPYPRRSRPATTCFSVLRILVAVALTTQLADSATLDEAPDWFSDSHEATASGSVPRESEDDKGALTPASSSGAQGKDSTRNANFRLRGQGFEVFYKVSNSVNDNDATEMRALLDEIFLTPEEQDEPDNTHGNRIGPGDIPELVDVNAECEHLLICHRVESYPTEAIKNIPNLDELMDFITPNSGRNRINMNPRDDELCSTKDSQWRRPEAIRKSMNDPWQYVVNVEKFPQNFDVYLCNNPNGECRNSFGELGLPLSDSICEQQYVERRVVVLKPGSRTASVDSFLIPGGCCCNLRKAPSARFGGNAAHTSPLRVNTRDRRHRHPRDN